jgi:hypothetical protein
MSKAAGTITLTVSSVPQVVNCQTICQSFLQLLRYNVKIKREQLTSEVLEMNEVSAETFWPMYREYEVELSRIYDERLSLMRSYEENWSVLNAARSDECARKTLALEARRTRLRSKYYRRLSHILSPVAAVKFLQIEGQLLSALDAEIASRLSVTDLGARRGRAQSPSEHDPGNRSGDAAHSL